MRGIVGLTLFGLGLVEAYENPHDRRYKVVSLTPEGERLVHKLADIWADD